MRLYDLTTQVELAAFDDAEFYDAMQRAATAGLYSAPQVVDQRDQLRHRRRRDRLGGRGGGGAAARPAGAAAARRTARRRGPRSASARIGYMTNFALADSHRRKWILTDLMAERHTAAELRSFTLRHFLLARVARLAAYARDAQLKAAGSQALTQVPPRRRAGVATAGVYAALGILLAAGALPLAVAGTAVLAIRSAQASLSTLLYAVNQCYEEGLYFSDYLAFCADAARRIPRRAARPRPGGFDRITADAGHVHLPGLRPSLRCARSASRSAAARWSPWSARTGRARPRWPRSWPGLYRPRAGHACAGTRLRSPTSTGEPLREQIAVIAQDHANWPLTVAAQHHHGPRRSTDALLTAAAAASGADTVIEKLAARLRHAARPPVQGRRRAVRRPVAADRRRARASTGPRRC